MTEKKAKPAARASKPPPPKEKAAAPAAKAAAPKSTRAGGKPVPSQRGKSPASARGVQVEAAAPAVVTPSEAQKEHGGFRRKIIGLVVGDKMNKTIVVEVIRKAMHPMYKKYVRVRNKYKAHDELNVYKVGDRVEIMEHRPISRHKRWLVTRLVSRPVEA